MFLLKSLILDKKRSSFQFIYLTLIYKTFHIRIIYIQPLPNTNAAFTQKIYTAQI